MKKTMIVMILCSLFMGCNNTSTGYETGVCGGSYLNPEGSYVEEDGVVLTNTTVIYSCSESLTEMECYNANGEPDEWFCSYSSCVDFCLDACVLVGVDENNECSYCTITE